MTAIRRSIPGRQGAADILAALVLGLAGLALLSPGHAQPAPGNVNIAQPSLPINLEIPLYKSRIVQLRQPVSQISVGNPEIADILTLQPRQIYVVAKALGTTNVVLWGARDRVIGILDVEVTHDLNSLKEKLHQVLPQEDIEVRTSGGAVVLSGEVSGPGKMDAAMKLAASYVPKDGQVVNLMQIGGAQQVMLEVKVAEVARTILKRMNIKFNAITAGGRWKLGGVNGGATFPDALFGENEERIPIFTDNNPIGPVIDEFNPTELSIADKGLFATFLNGDFLFNAVIDAAKNNGLARILAEPTLTTLTGQEAQFLSGGEFPIPVPDEDGTTIEFKEFGIGLRFLPVVLDSGRISLKVNVRVSQISAANSVVLGVAGSSASFAIPALSSRSASSTVELADGQTIAIAGLISESLREAVDKFPGLGDVPVLGMLFRSQSFQKEQTELVIFVTPRFARPTPPDQIRLPTDNFVEPSDLEFYLLGAMDAQRPHGAVPGDLQAGGAEGAFGHQLTTARDNP